MKSKSWFDVSKEGLAQLQAGKPKHYILRELVQNAWDEDTKYCKVVIQHQHGTVVAMVSDGSPEGFKDIKDAFTLFGDTSKRSDPTKRGRFNLGEKQAFAVCSFASIKTTKGTVVFDKTGRHSKRDKTDTGSEIVVEFGATKAEYNEILYMVKSYLPPEDIKYIINNQSVKQKKPVEIVPVSLTTEISKNGSFNRTTRKTDIHIHNANGAAYLYEMGLPVCEIDCKYSIDIQQKVPLGIDRETVPVSFLKDVYAEVLNVMAKELEEDESSQTWVRQGAEDERVDKTAVKTVLEKRYGDKVVVANPNDRVSIDNALSKGFRVVYGSEMSKGEWNNIKRDGLMASSTEMFGQSTVSAERINADENMLRVAQLAKRIARRVLDFSLNVVFVDFKGVAAQFGGDTLTFNVGVLDKGFFSKPASSRVINLIVHELGHINGMHTEQSYHETLTKLAGELPMIALREPEFFEVD